MNYKYFLSAAAALIATTFAAQVTAGNLLEIEQNNTFDADNTFVLLDDDTGLGGEVDGDDFWAQVKVAAGDLIFAATSSAGDTVLTVIDNDGATQVDNTGGVDEDRFGTDNDSGQGAASAIAGLEANTPGALYFQVEDGATAEYALCTVVANTKEVGLENEGIPGSNDHTAVATKYSKAVMFGALEEKDTYSFTAIKGSHLMVIMDNDAARDGDMVESKIRILKADASPIAESDTSATQANATNAVQAPVTGTYYVEFEKMGGTGNDYSFVICGATVHSPNPDEDETVGRGSIGDRIWFDRNRDGIQDEGEPGAAKVPLELLGDDMVTVIKRGKSKKDGSYRFSGLLNGTYYVRLPDSVDALISPQDATDDDLDSDADTMTGVTNHVVVSNAVGTVDTDIGVNADLGAAMDCDAVAPAPGPNDTAKKVSFQHKSTKILKFGGKDADIGLADITNPEYMKVCVYYNNMLVSEHYMGLDDPGLKLSPGKLIYKGKANVTGLHGVKISAGVGKGKYVVKAKGLGEAPPPGVTSVVIYIETAQMSLREEFAPGQIDQSGLKLKAKKVDP